MQKVLACVLFLAIFMYFIGTFSYGRDGGGKDGITGEMMVDGETDISDIYKNVDQIILSLISFCRIII